MNCTICKKKITLVPSAQKRVEKFGGNASDYTNAFTTHSNCQVEANRKSSLELVRKLQSTLDK